MSTAAFAPASYDSRPVATIRVVVHNLGPVKPGADISYNHWTVSLLVAPAIAILNADSPQSSVRLDMQPEGPQNGTLFINELEYLVSNSASAWFDFAVSSSNGILTVKAVKDLPQENKRHRYQMTEHGGCQWWCWTVINDLAHAGILSANAADELETVLRNNYSVRLAPFPHNIEVGTFY